MSRQTKTQSRLASHDIAKQLFLLEKPYKAMQDERELLKIELRDFGANTYIFDGGVVVVGEPEVRKFTGQVPKLDATKFMSLPPEQRKTLIDSGLVTIEDVYSRNAVARVETTLT